MDGRTIKLLAGLGAGFALILISRSGKAATPAQRYAPPAAGPAPDHLYGGASQLSPHFFLREWLKPPIQDYKLTQDLFDNVFALATKVLEPYRVKIDPSIIEITGGGRPQDFRTAAPMTVKRWDTGAATTLPAGSAIDDIIRAQGYSPVADSDHHRFAGADFVIKTNGQLDVAKMEQAYKDLQANADVRQVGIYRVNNLATHVHVAVVHPGHPRLTGAQFAYETGEGE